MTTLVTTLTGLQEKNIIFQFDLRTPVFKLPALGFPPDISIAFPSLPGFPKRPTNDAAGLSIDINVPTINLVQLLPFKLPSISFPPDIGIAFPKLPRLPNRPTSDGANLSIDFVVPIILIALLPVLLLTLIPFPPDFSIAFPTIPRSPITPTINLPGPFDLKVDTRVES